MTSDTPRATPRSPRLVADSLVLRDFEAGDTDGVLAIVGDDRVTYWLSFASRDRDQAQSMLDGILARQLDTPRGEQTGLLEEVRANPVIEIQAGPDAPAADAGAAADG